MTLVPSSNLSTAMWKTSVWKNDGIMERESEMREKKDKRNPIRHSLTEVRSLVQADPM